MIKRILVPTDFSEVSKQALAYALAFANEVGSEIVNVSHVFTPQTGPDTIVIPPTGEMMEEIRSSLKKFIEPFAKGHLSRLETEVQLGFAKDEIVNMSKDYDLIVMGTTGDSGMLERVFGNVASDVAQNAHCPVLLIPEHSKYRSYQQIAYSSNDLSGSPLALQKLIDFNDLFDARVHFIHVDAKGAEEDWSLQKQAFSSLFSRKKIDFEIKMSKVEADTVVDGLKDYLTDKEIGLLVMVTQHRGFWQSFFHQSQSKRMALDPSLPVLFLHLDKDN